MRMCDLTTMTQFLSLKSPVTTKSAFKNYEEMLAHSPNLAAREQQVNEKLRGCLKFINLSEVSVPGPVSNKNKEMQPLFPFESQNE